MRDAPMRTTTVPVTSGGEDATEDADGDEGHAHFEEGADEGGSEEHSVGVWTGIAGYCSVCCCRGGACSVGVHAVEDLGVLWMLEKI